MTKWFPKQKRNRFYNPTGEGAPESLIMGTLPSLFKAFTSRFFRKRPQPASWLHPQQIPFRSKELSITWIGHATFLIQVADINILTDPVFGEVSSFFPRILSPGIHFDTLPSIDYVLLSHNHWDHMDAASLTALRERHPCMQVLVPQGDKQWFAKRRFTAHEFSWWESHSIKKATFTFLPAVHWSGRGLFDTNRSLWGSWMVQAGNRSTYFGGDTAYGAHFKQIAHEYGPIDVALLPIGPCEPKEWMLRTHMDVEHSLQAFEDLGAQHFIPMHWGTFPFGNDQFDEPIIQLKKHGSIIKKGSIHYIKAGFRQIVP
ncbi:MAG: hypothetical protein ACD_64C00192G0001 [uncultured bacterium]|nr:MAG: hypothetical protein ACD_64C00192G0001 [uncultured bacterium]